MALADEIGRLAGVAERLTGPVGNKANTKALLIEPMLSALGWDTANLEHMVRDWPVRENVLLDYALRVGDANALFVEVLGANQGIDDEAFARQTVEHVNEAGAAWCVLTNGLTYRVYKANESVPADQRLFLEVDLAGAASAEATEQRLALLSRDSVINGGLQRAGDQVFTDPRVHDALVQLAANPSAAFLAAVAEAIGEPGLATSRLRESLARVFDAEVTTPPPAPAAPAARAARAAPSTPAAPAQRAAPSTPAAPAPRAAPAAPAPSTVGPPAGVGQAVPTASAPAAAPPPPAETAVREPPPAPAETAVREPERAPGPAPPRLPPPEAQPASPRERLATAAAAASSPAVANPPAVAAPADSAWERALPTPDAAPANPGPMPELAVQAEPAATSDPVWERALAAPEAPAPPAVPRVPRERLTTATPSVPDSAWTSELPAATPSGAAQPADATPQDAWALRLPAIPEAEPTLPAAPPEAAVEGPYTLSHHLGGKPSEIVDLFGQLDEYGRSLDAGRRIGPQLVEYLRGEKPCFSMEVQRDRVLLCVALDAATVKAWWWSPSANQYTIDIHARREGEMEFSVGGAAELEDARQLIKLAYSGPASPPAKP